MTVTSIDVAGVSPSPIEDNVAKTQKVSFEWDNNVPDTPKSEPEVERPARLLAPSDFGVEIGGNPSFCLAEILESRSRAGMATVKREILGDGSERITYSNILP